MSEWRQIKLSVLLNAIDNDHRFLLFGGEYRTFRTVFALSRTFRSITVTSIALYELAG